MEYVHKDAIGSLNFPVAAIRELFIDYDLVLNLAPSLLFEYFFMRVFLVPLLAIFFESSQLFEQCWDEGVRH